jgi:hypothetical protein
MNKKKVALIGNMNNNSFALLRYLLDYGIDAELLLLNHEHKHFLPQNDTYQIKKYPIMVSDFGMLPSSIWNLSRKKVTEDLSKYDFIIGCGPAPAILKLIGRKLDVFIPYGSDIYYVPFIPIKPLRSLKIALKSFNLKRLQRGGIKECELIILDYTNNEYEKLFSKLDIAKKRCYINIPFIYAPEFNPVSISSYYKDSEFYAKFLKIRKENELVIFHHSRHEWTDERIVMANKYKHTKGNYKLIEGFYRFVENKPKIKAHLVMFEYGEDVSRSKKLIEELNLGSYITWMPLMPRREILVGISLCDIGVGELDSSYFSYGAIFEFLAMAKPVIHYRCDDFYKGLKENMYPMYNANTSEQIYNILRVYKHNPEKFKQVGIKAHEWFVKEAVEKPLSLIIKQINEKKSN